MTFLESSANAHAPRMLRPEVLPAPSVSLRGLLQQVFPPPSLFTVNEKSKRYGTIMRGIEREAAVAKRITFVSVGLALGGLATRAFIKI